MEVDQFGQLFDFLLAEIAQVVGGTGDVAFLLEDLAVVIGDGADQIVGGRNIPLHSVIQSGTQPAEAPVDLAELGREILPLHDRALALGKRRGVRGQAMKRIEQAGEACGNAMVATPFFVCQRQQVRLFVSPQSTNLHAGDCPRLG